MVMTHERHPLQWVALLPQYLEFCFSQIQNVDNHADNEKFLVYCLTFLKQVFVNDHYQPGTQVHFWLLVTNRLGPRHSGGIRNPAEYLATSYFAYSKICHPYVDPSRRMERRSGIVFNWRRDGRVHRKEASKSLLSLLLISLQVHGRKFDSLPSGPSQI